MKIIEYSKYISILKFSFEKYLHSLYKLRAVKKLKSFFVLLKNYKRVYKLCKLRKEDFIPIVIDRKNNIEE